MKVAFLSAAGLVVGPPSCATRGKQRARGSSCAVLNSGGHRPATSVNHRMAWVEKDHKDHVVSIPLPWAGSPTTRPGYSEPPPAWRPVLRGVIVPQGKQKVG